MSTWVCEDCGQDNDDTEASCIACEVPRPQEVDPRYAGFKVGRVLSAEPVPKKDKLRQLKVDVGDATPLTIVTNASGVKENSHVVVATVGAMVEDEPVKKSNVGGVMSEGMLCNGPMLGWSGGDANAAAVVPDSFAPGVTPPSARPRMDGK
eukprot:NODE_2340_length_716_cov_97.944528_g1895_i0.p1 GENE.NODE_2340_length_716_cov_97.944528_g1895_i0~~NODE_2340_length_716_cov_97.944528_g1895_i0.p1  ORF type:complete len:168 (+),score=63.28 NODE_2340_length_716_cov_97.944528_g1895_i0:52-504(+)